MSGTITTSDTGGVTFEQDALLNVGLGGSITLGLLPITEPGNDVYLGDATLATATGPVAGVATAIIVVGVGGNDDTANGGSGNDQLAGMAGNDTLLGGDDNDVLYGNSGPISTGSTLINLQLDLSLGADGNDSLDGGTGNDTIFGDIGSDTVIGGSGADIMDGGTGNDWLSYAGSTNGGVSVALTSGIGLSGDASGDEFTGFENLIGTEGDDFLGGTGVANTILGGAGNDTVLLGAGADSADGGDGDADYLNYSSSGEAVTLDLGAGTGSGGDAEGDSFSGFENAVGGGADDSLLGSAAENTLIGGGGDDTVDGGAGADSLVGGDGSGDWVVYANDTGVTVDLEAGTGSGGDAEGDQFSGVENVLGGSGDDVLGGDDTANYLDGGDGDDTIAGSIGNDTLMGGAGDGDALDYSGATDPVVIDLEAGTAEDGEGGTDTIDGFEVFTLGGGGDTVIAGSGDQDFYLGDGNNEFEWTDGDGMDTVRLGGDSETLDLQGWTGDDSDPWTTSDGGDGSTIFSNSGGGGVQVYGFDGAEDFIACFAEGSMIATDRGEVPVEALRAGDLVLNVHGGPRLVPLRWVGRSRMNIAHQRDKTTVAPILIRAGALADGVPNRDLRLSPEHALFLDGMLVPARMLVNGETIIQESWCREVTYYHLEIEGHGVLIADGAFAESYVDDGNRALFDNAAVIGLSADFEAYRGNGRYASMACAPIAAEGPALRAIRQRLADRVGCIAQFA